jgi:hypothetical protein
MSPCILEYVSMQILRYFHFSGNHCLAKICGVAMPQLAQNLLRQRVQWYLSTGLPGRHSIGQAGAVIDLAGGLKIFEICVCRIYLG